MANVYRSLCIPRHLSGRCICLHCVIKVDRVPDPVDSSFKLQYVTIATPLRFSDFPALFTHLRISTHICRKTRVALLALAHGERHGDGPMTKANCLGLSKIAFTTPRLISTLGPKLAGLRDRIPIQEQLRCSTDVCDYKTFTQRT